MNTELFHEYAHSFEALTLANLDCLATYVSPHIHFRDPFNDVHQWTQMRLVFVDMFERTQSHRFTTLEVYPNTETASACVYWRFEASFAKLGTLDILGTSRLQADTQGYISEHLDFWDPSPLYRRLPVFGSALGWIQSKLAI